MKLKEYIVVKGIISCETGLRIGGSKDSLEIGAMDNPIIRHPVNGLPYVPGSSLKGKMRSLLEIKAGTYQKGSGRPCDCGSCEICILFGCGDPSRSTQMTRLIFRDAMITSDSEKRLREAQEEKGLNFSEIKNENWIDRNTGKAGRGGLRTQERVPEGTTFNFEMSIRIFENDDSAQFLDKIKDGLGLMQQDYLGSSGSRGYGKIKFLNLTFNDKAFNI
ncbi:MAG: type III-A CRISPR-associated RAMP protein Csm3 [Deltaproteobacteria bacterium]|nr:type III-A CRISPR-associated RAMP protein Csm3 [Deltaproteobacteria bacterium]